MKILMFLCCCLGGCTLASAQITMTLYEADGITPFDFRDIMVGTKLTVVVESTSVSSSSWCGGLFITGNDRFWGLLSGRDRNPNIIAPNCQFNNGSASGEPGDWTGSHFPSAGLSASVYTYKDSLFWGFDMQSDNTAVAGDWFVFDYTAINVGQPVIGFYDYAISFFDPIQTLTPNHVPTRDFNGDGNVDSMDFSLINTNWMATNCQDPNWCDQTDVSRDGNVNVDDLRRFIDFWLVEI